MTDTVKEEWHDIPTGAYCLTLFIAWPPIRIIIELIRWIINNGIFTLKGDALKQQIIANLIEWIAFVAVMTLVFALSKAIHNRRSKI